MLYQTYKVIILAIFIGCVVFCGSAGGDDGGKQELVLEMHMDGGDYLLGEPLWVSFSIKNISDKNILIVYDKLFNSCVKFEIVDPDGNKIERVKQHIGKWIGPAGPEAAAIVAPGQELVDTVYKNIENIYEMYNINKPGKYSISAYFESDGRYIVHQEGKDGNGNLLPSKECFDGWKGKIVTDPIKVNIIEPNDVQDKEFAAEIIKGGYYRHGSDFKPLIEKYPGSIYVNYAYYYESSYFITSKLSAGALMWLNKIEMEKIKPLFKEKVAADIIIMQKYEGLEPEKLIQMYQGFIKQYPQSNEIKRLRILLGMEDPIKQALASSPPCSIKLELASNNLEEGENVDISVTMKNELDSDITKIPLLSTNSRTIGLRRKKKGEDSYKPDYSRLRVTPMRTGGDTHDGFSLKKGESRVFIQSLFEDTSAGFSPWWLEPGEYTLQTVYFFRGGYYDQKEKWVYYEQPVYSNEVTLIIREAADSSRRDGIKKTKEFFYNRDFDSISERYTKALQFDVSDSLRKRIHWYYFQKCLDYAEDKLAMVPLQALSKMTLTQCEQGKVFTKLGYYYFKFGENASNIKEKKYFFEKAKQTLFKTQTDYAKHLLNDIIPKYEAHIDKMTEKNISTADTKSGKPDNTKTAPEGEGEEEANPAIYIILLCGAAAVLLLYMFFRKKSA